MKGRPGRDGDRVEDTGRLTSGYTPLREGSGLHRLEELVQHTLELRPGQLPAWM